MLHSENYDKYGGMNNTMTEMLKKHENQVSEIVNQLKRETSRAEAAESQLRKEHKGKFNY